MKRRIIISEKQIKRIFNNNLKEDYWQQGDDDKWNLLEKDLRILAVNVDYGIKTEIGKYNLDRIPLMGSNLLIFRPELILHKRLIRIGLEEYGDPDLLSHTLLHSYPLHIAKQFKIIASQYVT